MRKLRENVSGWALPAIVLALLSAPRDAHALATVVVGNWSLLGNTPNQKITISITGNDQVAGLDLFAQIGDGGTFNNGVNSRPVFQSVDILTGAVFASNNHGQSVDATQFTHPLIADTSTTTNSGTVLDSGKLVTLTVDTTLVTSGTFPLLLNNVAANNGGPFATDLIDGSGKTVPLTIINGSISVPEPAALSLAGFSALLLLRRRVLA